MSSLIRPHTCRKGIMSKSRAKEVERFVVKMSMDEHSNKNTIYLKCLSVTAMDKGKVTGKCQSNSRSQSQKNSPPCTLTAGCFACSLAYPPSILSSTIQAHSTIVAPTEERRSQAAINVPPVATRSSDHEQKEIKEVFLNLRIEGRKEEAQLVI